MRRSRRHYLVFAIVAVLMVAITYTACAFGSKLDVVYTVAGELYDHYSNIMGVPESIRPGMRFCYEYMDESMKQEPNPLFDIDTESRSLMVFDVVAKGTGGVSIYGSELQSVLGTSAADLGISSSTGWKAAGPFWASPEIMAEAMEPKNPSYPSSAQKYIEYKGEKVAAQTFFFVGDDGGRIEASYDKSTGVLLKLAYTAPEGDSTKKDAQKSFELTLYSMVEMEPSSWSIGSTDTLKEGLELEYEGTLIFTLIKGVDTTGPYHESIKVASTDGFLVKLETTTELDQEPYVSYQYSGAPDSMPYYIPKESLDRFEADTFLFYDDAFPSIVRVGKTSLDPRFGRVIAIELSHGTSTTTARYSMETGWLVSYYRTIQLLFTFEIDARLKALPQL